MTKPLVTLTKYPKLLVIIAVSLIIIVICVIAETPQPGTTSSGSVTTQQIQSPTPEPIIVPQNTSELLQQLGPCKNTCYADYEKSVNACKLQYNTTGMDAEKRNKMLDVYCYNPVSDNLENCYDHCEELYYPEEERVIVRQNYELCCNNCSIEWSELRCVRMYNVTRQNLSSVNATIAEKYEQCAKILSGTVGDCCAICDQQYYVPLTPTPVRTPVQTTQLNVVTDPSGGAVEIDGIDQQVKTPVSLPMKAGKHTVTLILDGYRNYSIVFDSSPFETWNITHTFELSPSSPVVDR